MAFNGDAMRELAAQFLALAEKQGATIPLMIGHRLMGMSLLLTGDIAEGRAHFDQAIALYDPAEHRPLATRFGQDAAGINLSYRSLALWILGYPEAALADARARSQGCARDWPRSHADVCAACTRESVILVRKLRDGNAQLDENYCFGGRKRCRRSGRRWEC